MKHRTRRPTVNAKRKASPLRLDPTRTATIRRAFTALIAGKFARLKGDVYRLVVEGDAFGLLPPVANYDPDQPRDDRGRFGSGGVGRAFASGKALVGRGKEAATAVLDRVPGGKWLRGRVAAFNAALVARYGKRNTALIMASAQAISWGAAGVGAAVGTPLYVPSLVAMAPGAALAEMHYQYRKHFGGAAPRLAANEDYPELTAGEVAEEARRLLSTLSQEYARHLESIGPTVNAPWVAATDPQKVKAFGDWLRAQAKGRLRSAGDEELWRDYARQGFEKGAARAFDDTRRSKAVQALDRESMAAYQGSRGEFLRSAFGNPVSVEKVQLLAQRSFADLENVTEDMATRLTRTLADGLVQGQSPHEIARTMADDIDVSRARAETIARSEIVRAHAEGQLTALEQLGVEEVGVAVEWTPTDDAKLCPRCAAMEGVVLKLAEARGLIPLHPGCRCAWVPANVGESDAGRKDTKGEIDKAADAAGLDDLEISIGRPEPLLKNALLRGYERFLNNGWVTLETGQHVFIGPGGEFSPSGPGPWEKGTPAPATAVPQLDIRDPKALAAAVHEAGKALPSYLGHAYEAGQTHAHKVTVSDLHDALKERAGGASLDQFKAALLAGHNADALELSNANLREGVPRHLVGRLEAGAVRHAGGSEYQVVVANPQAPAAKALPGRAELSGAFDRLDRAAGGYNFVSVRALREAVGGPADHFDRKLKEMIKEGALWTHVADSSSPAERAGGIKFGDEVHTSVSKRK